jgi:hypothetical protein
LSYFFKTKVLTLERFGVFLQSLRNHIIVYDVILSLPNFKIQFNSFIFILSPPPHVFLTRYFVVLHYPIIPCRNFLKKQANEVSFLITTVKDKNPDFSLYFFSKDHSERILFKLQDDRRPAS